MHKIGRRKSSIANVQAVLGTGKILINKKLDHIYFQQQSLLLSIIHSPLQKIQAENKYDFYITVTGGGISSQASAIKLAIAKILTTENAGILSNENAKENRMLFKQEHFLTRDPRAKERRKYGLKKARRASQFSKR